MLEQQNPKPEGLQIQKKDRNITQSIKITLKATYFFKFSRGVPILIKSMTQVKWVFLYFLFLFNTHYKCNDTLMISLRKK